ncbi:MAG: CorA family divalent cation transporter [Acidobacteriota bacterium]
MSTASNDENLEIRAFLYNASGNDAVLERDGIDIASVSDDQLLWINVSTDDDPDLRSLFEELQLPEFLVRRVEKRDERPTIEKFDDLFRFNIHSIITEKGKSPSRTAIEFIVGKNAVITIQESEISYFSEFRERDRGETHFGQLDAESFVCTLLDLHLVSYFEALEEVERKVDKLDERVLKRDLETDEFLQNMVDLRNDVSKLRRWLLPHRDVIYSLSRADFQQIAQSDSAERFRMLNQHFENAVNAIESSRDTVLSTFDLYATKAAQTMNIFIQRLTFLTLITGSLSVIAGILGMNYKVGFFDSPMGFWLTIAGMLLVGVGLTIIARFRRWI